MIVTEPEPFWDYLGNNNVLVIPITKFVKKDGTLAMVDDIAKEASERYPTLAKRWGYLMESGIDFPRYRAEGVNLLGVPTKEHYAANPDAEMIEGGLLYLYDVAFSDTKDHIYYLPVLGGPEFLELHRETLANTSIYSNIIVLAEGIEEND